MVKLLKSTEYVKYLQRNISWWKKQYYILKMGAPMEVLWMSLRHKQKRKSLRHTYSRQESAFAEKIQSLSVSNDWFSHNIDVWLAVFNECGLREKQSLQVLEIGSWEGLSSYFILSELPNAHIVCVDTWAGSSEHGDWDLAKDNIRKSKHRFEQNLSCFKDRVTVFQGRSLDYFASQECQSGFDFIYVDGSHHVDDVVMDVIKCFELLKVGGLIILDDYRWRHYKNPMNNPCSAINAFLKLKKGQYKIIYVFYQLYIMKTMSDDKAIAMVE